MSMLDTKTIREKMEAIKLHVAELQTEVRELGMLLALANKYTTASPLTRVAAGALQAMDSTILANGRTKRERIVETVTDILRSGERRSSRYLLAELIARGVEIAGSDSNKKSAALSAYLSKENGLFDSNVKEGGWTLSSLLTKGEVQRRISATGPLFNGSQANHP